MNSWRYLEPCCGSASIALALLGARRPPLPYQGSKWRFRRELLDHFRTLGFDGSPAHVTLQDVGPWGRVAPQLLRTADRHGVIAHLVRLGDEDPRACFERLHGAPVPDDDVAYAAEFLFLQRLAYSGKAVGDGGGRWSSPGFNTSSAYGLPGTDRFGAVKPMIPSLLRVLHDYDGIAPHVLHGLRGPAMAPTSPHDGPTLVYLDPPYAHSTRYPAGDLGREGVVDLALAHHHAGASVVISEGEVLPELLALGWTGSLLNPGRQDSSPFRGKQPEWLTTSPR